MKIKIYLFRFAVAFTAFVFGIAFFNAGQYFQSAFSTAEQKAELIEPVSIEEITYPLPIIEQAKTPAFEQTDATADSDENTGCEYDGYGDYYVVGDLPKEFKDFYGINLATRNFKAKSEDCPIGIPIPPEGYVQTTREYKFTRINMGNKQIAFETETIKEISYKFTGKFVVLGVLEGRLTKMRNGKKVDVNQTIMKSDSSH
jgi:hypothetical protein